MIIGIYHCSTHLSSRIWLISLPPFCWWNNNLTKLFNNFWWLPDSKDVLQTFLWTFEILRDQVKKDLGIDPSNRINVQHTHTIHAWNMYLHLVVFFPGKCRYTINIPYMHAMGRTLPPCLFNKHIVNNATLHGGSCAVYRHRNPTILPANSGTLLSEIIKFWSGIHPRKQTNGYPTWWALDEVASFKTWSFLVSMLDFWSGRCALKATALSFQKLC